MYKSQRYRKSQWSCRLSLSLEYVYKDIACLFQLSNGSRNELSGYCPLDLFSGYVYQCNAYLQIVYALSKVCRRFMLVLVNVTEALHIS